MQLNIMRVLDENLTGSEDVAVRNEWDHRSAESFAVKHESCIRSYVLILCGWPMPVLLQVEMRLISISS
jgi:hypothetical protein